MILFLNFAPISFMGGAEKWMNDTAKKIDSQEKTLLVSVAGNIASVYSSLVLKRTFDDRADEKNIHSHLSLDWRSFIPFSNKYQKTKKEFQSARLIYARYELLEFLILIYFAGWTVLKKTVAGLHSPFIYQSPETFFDHLHNLVYGSFISKQVLRSVKKVHVLNQRDAQFLKQKFYLKNVAYVPNGMPTQIQTTKIQSDDKLHILYVGELSQRKGTDRLIEVIQNAPPHFVFTIAGDGPYQSAVKDLAKRNSNCIYKGFVKPSELAKLYTSNEVLFLPSRAESMPLSILEALSFGLTIVDSQEVSLQLDRQIEYSPAPKDATSFIHIFNQIYDNKKNKQIFPNAVKKYFDQNFSSNYIDLIMSKKIFGNLV